MASFSRLSRCSRCGVEHSRSHRWCLKCHALNMRLWRASHPLTPSQRLKDNARSYANVYLKRGKLKRLPCWCGARAEMHHPDYHRPLLVEWLCREHHLELHRKAKAA